MTSFDRWLQKALSSGLMSFDRCNLREANLRGADLRGADLGGADLRGADLGGADLRGADLYRAVLSGAYLRGAYLGGADLRGADLGGADLRGADLYQASLSGCDLSGCTGLLDAREWLSANFAADAEGIIVYKRIGSTEFQAPAHWKAEPGAVLTEVCNPCRTADCACGVNFGTEAWCRHNYRDAKLWRCRIEWLDLAGVVVPYQTDGKARCARLVLLEAVA